mmetsp:Transcript_62907/g.142169  ORF Transcript_62907/g.142169 Transcript_62907/m.142169 type:complete len:200 (-) Transcript_62907:152-751(-)|eukprot:CAMPEP_0197897716 /NCGR_PEP_ID=MMETSP1439-20131203/42336_1 /TAXON_ID=66791 /ORGANISM="Gonyaulax spinifera, Strain CCMP409" /LENGTH=199 /DNA_ID=CAMNT_0043518365 /DNA_START=52 /DNA_END=651 /DNA_ORIENTATION=-
MARLGRRSVALVATLLGLSSRFAPDVGFAGPAPRAAPLRSVTARSALDKALVQSTWKAAVPEANDQNLVAVGTLLFERLFESEPAALELFPFMKGEDREKVKSKALYKAHVKGVAGAVNDAVQGLDELEDAAMILERLGRRHNNYGTQAAHYDLVGDAFLWTLEQALAPKGLWTPEAKESWTEVWGVVAGTMKKGQGFN